MDSVMARWAVANPGGVQTLDDYDKEVLRVIQKDMVAKFLGMWNVLL